ncbi:MAG TPA: hypothetical protein VI818_05370 [Candidatus Thermoplasmatota archaeon]|nr:hypothetical protein [Candidatus Thermoplasmatota archaeon]
MPDPSPAAKAAPRAAVFLLLLFQVVGTIALVSYGWWKLWEEDRGDGLLYLSLGVLWFMLTSWRLRWLLHPKPQ